MSSAEDPKDFLEHAGKTTGRKRVTKTIRKPSVPICENLRFYLTNFNREQQLPIRYNQLERFQMGAPLYDANGDDTVNFDDLNLLLENWGTAGPQGDVDADGDVDFDDLNLLLENWSITC